MSVNDSPVSPAAVLYNPFGQVVPINTDAFNRLRVSTPVALFDSKQINSNGVPLYFSEFTATGGTTTYNAARASTTLACTNSVGSRALRQTRIYFNYQPGKSQFAFLTFVLGAATANVVKAAGYYDDNNGIFFRLNGTTKEIVIRSNVTGVVVNNAIAQASWNLDPLNGSGPSGLILDTIKAQILVIDFQWLGVGAVRVGFDINGIVIWAHQFNNANSITSVYMFTPNLPMRWEIVGSGTAESLEAICCSITSEGGEQTPVGVGRSVDRGGPSANWKSLASANPEQVIALRLQSGKRGPASFLDIDFIITSNQNTYWALCVNPTVGGAAVWQAVANSIMEYDVNLNTAGSRVVSNFGTILASGYISGTQRVSASPPLGALQSFAADYAGTADILSLVCHPDGNQTVAAAMSYLEPS
jgi:hypothetical protein